MDLRPVKIYAKEDVPRLRYIAGIIFGDILGLPCDVITDRRKLGKSIVINYSSEKVAGSFKINPVNLLFEKGVSNQELLITEWKGLPVFFQTDPDSDLPFDIFAASFYLLSRYEEYQDFKPDQYGRFQANMSLAYKNGFLDKPVVDLWVKELSKSLLKKFNNLAFKRNNYKALLTIDTDQPFANAGRSFFDSIGAIFDDITHHNGHGERKHNGTAKGEKDPFDVFDYIFDNIEKHKSESRFFIAVGDSSKYDKNPSWKNSEYRKLINRITRFATVGLHPSFNAGTDFSLVTTELQRLKNIVKDKILLSRFHYGRLFFPQSYAALLTEGITEDYSMGYTDEPGFRAGIARPYYFYNISVETQTNMRIIPFQVMDETLHSYKNMTPAKAQEIVLKLIVETKNAGGLFISIWHNTSLLDNPQWQPWRNVFEFMLKNQKL